MARIDPGKRAPNFVLHDQHGERHTLDKYRGRVVVLYFYPKDETPDCTIQACQFRDHHPDFSKIDAAVLGVSPDDQESHALFAGNHGIHFPLLADTKPDGAGQPAVSAAYGAWQEKVLYGRRYKGIVRTTYLIDREGVVRRRWDRVRVTGHSGEVLEAVKVLLGANPGKVKPSRKRASESKARAVTRARGGVAKKARTGRAGKTAAKKGMGKKAGVRTAGRRTGGGGTSGARR